MKFIPIIIFSLAKLLDTVRKRNFPEIAPFINRLLYYSVNIDKMSINRFIFLRAGLLLGCFQPEGVMAVPGKTKNKNS